ncbi:protein N-lysine methyltransferase METTL21D-like [Clytia hemisphaerica]|uniref:Uncharacterized protein n=1 Tax=Clytia hemisphaerica TaxID=252671 RepID=A0A7M5V724_9CNID|eukprot:TCONS_00013218-protein
MADTYFTREIDFSKGDVIIHQSYIGDVGHVVWDAAIVLAKFLDGKYFTSNETLTLQGKSVVELGSGTGLVGLVAAMNGASVRITDLNELVPLMEKNIEANQHLLQGNAKAESLKWGVDLEMKMKADIILIADCIYYDESLEPLVNTMHSLCHETTVIYMSYEERNTDLKIELEKKFFKLLDGLFSTERISRDLQDPLYNSDDIHILKISLLKR